MEKRKRNIQIKFRVTEEEKQYQNDWFNAKLHEMLYQHDTVSEKY